MRNRDPPSYEETRERQEDLGGDRREEVLCEHQGREARVAESRADVSRPLPKVSEHRPAHVRDGWLQLRAPSKSLQDLNGDAAGDASRSTNRGSGWSETMGYPGGLYGLFASVTGTSTVPEPRRTFRVTVCPTLSFEIAF